MPFCSIIADRISNVNGSLELRCYCVPGRGLRALQELNFHSKLVIWVLY